MSERDATDEGAVEIRAVLDVSAIRSYIRGHIHVGEILVEVAADGAYVGLPAVALLDAYVRVGRDEPGRARIGVLAALPGVRVLELGARDAAEISLAAALVDGDLARAHAVSTALDHRAYYLTTEPKSAPAILTADQVHLIPDDDA